MKPFLAVVALILGTVVARGQEPDVATSVQKPEVASGTTEYSTPMVVSLEASQK